MSSGVYKVHLYSELKKARVHQTFALYSKHNWTFFFFHHTDMSTSEQNLSDEFEGELPAEEKPRLTFTQDIPPAIHYGHKLDMIDRDPVKMNDHVKVQK